MDRKMPIELRFPHMVPERIREYALGIFDRRYNVDAIDLELQIYAAFLCCAEAWLKRDPMNSDYFNETRKNEYRFQGLQELIKENRQWQEFRRQDRWMLNHDYVAYGNWTYPFFATYFFDNNLTSVKGALQILLKEHPLIGMLSSVEEKDSDTLLQGDKQLPNKTYDRTNKYELLPGAVPVTDADFISLGNNYFLLNFGDRYTLRPAFVVEGITLAKELENEICHGEYVYWLEKLKKFYDQEKPVNDRAEFEKIYSMRDGFKWFGHPYGDAVVTAPMGCFFIPEISDWSPLKDRDIYIFKLGERNPDKSVNQLLRVGAAIIRDAGKESAERMHFIIMAEKTSNKVNENKINYLTLNELFEKAEIYSIKLPERIMELYEEYRRKKGPQHLNPYVIDPFLRRKSWALLSGEEGTGKSYLAMLLGAALATQGKLFFDWTIRRRKCKILYVVDDEMTDDILSDRKRLLDRLYPGNGENLYIKPVHRLNILNESGKEDIKKSLIEFGSRGNADTGAVEVLILDHLLKLTANHGDEEENWVTVRDWIEDEICDKGISVILLHHEYAGARMMGSKIIANDAPARIHLEAADSPNKDQIDFKISLIKNRGGRTFRQPRIISLKLGSHPHWFENQENDPSHQTDGKIPFRKIPREERIRLVTEWRETMTVEEVAEKLGCKKSSVEKIITSIRRQ